MYIKGLEESAVEAILRYTPSQVKQLEEEVAWRAKYGDYMNHQYNMSSSVSNQQKTNEKIKINKTKNNFFSGSLNY